VARSTIGLGRPSGDEVEHSKGVGSNRGGGSRIRDERLSKERAVRVTISDHRRRVGGNGWRRRQRL
jgi:hypothetical protein